MTESFDFVNYLLDLPARPVTITGIKPDTRDNTTRTFKSADGIAEFIEAQQSDGRNVYFQDCSVSTIDWRPKKEHVTAIHCAHVDIDAHGVLDAAGLERAKADILERLGTQLAPTDIIDTGNGIQAFWFFTEPTTDIVLVESINRALCAALGGDKACVDVAHLCRIPGTVNFPSAKKRELGRVQCRSKLLSTDRDFGLFKIGDLPQAAGTVGGEDVPLIAPGEYDLSVLSDGVRDLIQKGPSYLFKGGIDCPKQIGDGSRSDFTFNVACRLRWHFFTDGQIVGVITDPANAASAHILAQKQRTPEAQASRAIAAMNKKGATTMAEKGDFADGTQYDSNCGQIPPESHRQRIAREWSEHRAGTFKTWEYSMDPFDPATEKRRFQKRLKERRGSLS